MTGPILTAALRWEQDLVSVRKRARDLSELLGFDPQDQTRIATAVSEMGRNAFRYAGGGKVEFRIEGATPPQLLVVRISDEGPGIPNLREILSGNFHSSAGMGLGITGTRRLMDQFDIETTPGRGTVVTLKKFLPRRPAILQASTIERITEELARRHPAEGPFDELQRQNQELLHILGELRRRQDELSVLNRELEDTNRGVVALYAELDEKASHLRRADQLKTRFLSNMSHEFRTPVNSILALSNLLLNRKDSTMDADERQQVSFIKKAGEGLLELVNDLLDLAKVEAGKVEVHPVEFTVPDLFSALRGMLRPLLVNSQLNLAFESPTDIPTLVTDEGKVSQILRNFISNGLKFTEAGEVRVAAQRQGDSVIFSVSDTGIGIAPENLERIFQEFAQIDSPSQRRTKGTGLGLPLARKLAELLGGSVRVDSVPGQGSTFYASIPLVFRLAVSKVETTWQIDSRRTPILLVEDSIEIRLVYEEYLRNSPYQLVAVPSLREARQALRVFQPAAFILDVMLQGEDTWSFLAELKATEQTRSIPVLLQTVVDDEPKALALGADAFLQKPVSRETLLKELTRLVVPRCRVLVIDDDDLSRYLIRQVLREFPCAIIEAIDGHEALQRVRQVKPDLITLDLSMPGLTGFDVLDELKSDPATQLIPVIILTSKLLSGSEREQLALQAHAVLNKSALGDTPAKAVFAELLNSPHRVSLHDV
ncbi:MAG TPA: ATP-binding protein [Candidatus Sulfopaludibacter sp.]|jgi:signal transduction histidine kinase/CheY-like chemotaxis protein|nr:ATP-binding protein [Candidatus Sulfopaludibacter sp.]